VLEMGGRRGEGRGGDDRRGEERRGDGEVSCRDSFFFLSLLLLFGITEHEIAARTSHVKQKNPSPT